MYRHVNWNNNWGAFQTTEVLEKMQSHKNLFFSPATAIISIHYQTSSEFSTTFKWYNCLTEHLGVGESPLAFGHQLLDGERAAGPDAGAAAAAAASDQLADPRYRHHAPAGVPQPVQGNICRANQDTPKRKQIIKANQNLLWY